MLADASATSLLDPTRPTRHHPRCLLSAASRAPAADRAAPPRRRPARHRSPAARAAHAGPRHPAVCGRRPTHATARRPPRRRGDVRRRLGSPESDRCRRRPTPTAAAPLRRRLLADGASSPLAVRRRQRVAVEPSTARCSCVACATPANASGDSFARLAAKATIPSSTPVPSSASRTTSSGRLLRRRARSLPAAPRRRQTRRSWKATANAAPMIRATAARPGVGPARRRVREKLDRDGGARRRHRPPGALTRPSGRAMSASARAGAARRRRRRAATSEPSPRRAATGQASARDGGGRGAKRRRRRVGRRRVVTRLQHAEQRRRSDVLAKIGASAARRWGAEGAPLESYARSSARSAGVKCSASCYRCPMSRATQRRARGAAGGPTSFTPGYGSSARTSCAPLGGRARRALGGAAALPRASRSR